MPKTLTLTSWLRRLPPPSASRPLLGGTGHLLLTPEVETDTRRALRDAFDHTFSADKPSHVTLVSCVAPGADLLFLRTARAWLHDRGIPHSSVALLPLPVETLIEDWLLKAREHGATPSDAEIEDAGAAISAALALSETIVNLQPSATTLANRADRSFRQCQYRHAAACLAEQCDLLFALLRDSSPQLPGGTAEIVRWRGDPTLIPRLYSTLALRRPAPSPSTLIRIDPGPLPPVVDPAGALVQQCRQALRVGNYLRAYDLATRASAVEPEDRELDYLAILSLVNAGSTRLALQRYEALRLTEQERSEDWLALEGRLLKEMALTYGDHASGLFLRAAEAYRAAYRRTGGYFPAINAATMFRLGGFAEDAATFARAAADVAATGTPRDEIDAYYRTVTAAEAALLLGEIDRCRSLLGTANRQLPDNVNARSRTATQLRLICRRLGWDESLLDPLTPAPVLCVLGRAPTSGMPPIDASVAFAALLEPADLDTAQLLSRCGARLHLIVPAPRAAMIEHWRQQHGADAVAGLEACLGAADELSVANGFLPDEPSRLADYVTTLAAGLSRLSARQLNAPWQLLDFEIGAQPLTADEATSHLTRRNPTPAPVLPQAGPPRREFIGTIFADFTGFSRLSEADIPLFQMLHIGAIAEVLRRSPGRILRQHTWGDAVHIVTADAATAAALLIGIHDAISALRPRLEGPLAQLELRLAGHYAPVHVGIDPIEQTPLYFGSQLSFAARIEPVTPPGMIFVTEAFAARLALDAPDRYITEYAGEIELAKRYGQYRLFSLRGAPM